MQNLNGSLQQYLKSNAHILIYFEVEHAATLQLSRPLCILQEKTMFSIPWKHAARHGWELDKDASLFKLWAIHTGERARVCSLLWTEAGNPSFHLDE